MKTKTFTMRMTEQDFTALEHLSDLYGKSKGHVMSLILRSEFVESPDGYLSAFTDRAVNKKLMELAKE